MNKRILTICLALALCLSMIPVTAFAGAPLYTYQEIATGIEADGVSMMGNGMGSYKVYDEAGEELIAKGVIDPSGKVILTRSPKPNEGMMAGDATNDVHYVSVGGAIVDMMRFFRYAPAEPGGALVDEPANDDDMRVHLDVAIYTKDGELAGYVSDIISSYADLPPEVLEVATSIYFGSDGYLTVSSVEEAASYAYIIDPETMQVKAKHFCYDYGPTAESEEWKITSANEGLIAYNHNKTEWNADGTDLEFKYVTAGWMDINGTHKLSVDTKKYSNWWNFSDGLAMVYSISNGMCGYVDKTGKEVIPCRYYWGSTFRDGYAYAQDKDYRYGYIDKTGKTVIPFEYEYAFGYGDGLFTVGHAGQYDNFYGMVDKNNNEVVPIVYTDISAAKNGVAYAIKDGELVILKFEADEEAAKDVTNIFPDVNDGDWFKGFVQDAYDNGIIKGFTDGTYQPNGKLKHCEIMVMVAKLHSMQKGDGFEGVAVPGDHWAASYRDYCKEEGIIDARFDEGLDAYVTRAEMAYYFARTLDDASYKDTKDISFTDMPENGYDEYIMRLAKTEIVTGYEDKTTGTFEFRPGKDVSRAEAATFISKILAAME